MHETEGFSEGKGKASNENTLWMEHAIRFEVIAGYILGTQSISTSSSLRFRLLASYQN